MDINDEHCVTNPDGSCVGGLYAGKPACMHGVKPETDRADRFLCDCTVDDMRVDTDHLPAMCSVCGGDARHLKYRQLDGSFVWGLKGSGLGDIVEDARVLGVDTGIVTANVEDEI